MTMPGDNASARNLFGAGYGLLSDFAQRWAETSASATQNALGRTIDFADAVFAATSYMDIVQEFTMRSNSSLPATSCISFE